MVGHVKKAQQKLGYYVRQRRFDNELSAVVDLHQRHLSHFSLILLILEERTSPNLKQ